jgi:hypothetical protein
MGTAAGDIGWHAWHGVWRSSCASWTCCVGCSQGIIIHSIVPAVTVAGSQVDAALKAAPGWTSGAALLPPPLIALSTVLVGLVLLAVQRAVTARALLLLILVCDVLYQWLASSSCCLLWLLL